MKALSLFLLLLLSACSTPRTAPVEEAAPPTPPAPPVVEEPVEKPAEPEKEIPADTLEFQDGRLILTLGQERSYEGIFLQEIDGEGDISISLDGTEVYRQENSQTQRFCYLGEQTSSTIEIDFSEGCSVRGAEVIKTPEDDTSLSAYLPYNTWTPRMLENGSLEQLDDITVNVGVYWRGDGSLEVKDGLREMLAAIHSAYPDLEIFCTINPKKGGAAALFTPESRQLLIENMLTFAEEEQLSGIDIDWEFPADDQWDEFSELIVELSTALHSADKRLSLAFYPDTATLSQEAIQSIHRVHVMAYDQFDDKGYHSTYAGAVEAIDSFLTLGFREEQLSLGIPAYGRPTNEAAEWPFYGDHAAELAEDRNLLNNNYFNSPQLVQDKALLSAQKGLQGVFLYHLGCDSSDGESISLREAAAAVLK